MPGAEDEAQAKKVARAIADSPLVKTCMHGGTPTGAGSSVPPARPWPAGRCPTSTLHLCGVLTVQGGAAAVRIRRRTTRAMHAGHERAGDRHRPRPGAWAPRRHEIFFADMGHEYITINAEYHT